MRKKYVTANNPIRFEAKKKDLKWTTLRRLYLKLSFFLIQCVILVADCKTDHSLQVECTGANDISVYVSQKMHVLDINK